MSCSCGSSLMVRTRPKSAPTLSTYRLIVGHFSALLVKRAPLSGRSSPAFQNPRQSSSPSAVAIGAKFVSPPLFQSMYSRSRYSCSGISNGRSVRRTKPCGSSTSRRGCGVRNGISHDQWSAFGQKLVTIKGSLRARRLESGPEAVARRPASEHPGRELGELAEQRPRVARGDDLLDEERFRRLERRLPRGEALFDLGAQRVGIIRRLELRLVRGFDPTLERQAAPV